MTSPGGRIAILVEPDLRGFTGRLSSGLESSARTGVAAFASVAKKTLLAAAVGIGAASVVAAKSTLDIGMAYQDQLNTLQAVSQATEGQMQSVGRTAKELGRDLTLPATSAADAAAVMTELAKANFSVDEAQQAAKGSLQLAAAAQIDGAQAATIQANAINAFGLAATDASRVADVLANAANASSAEITDVADALAQASAVAASAKIPIEDTAAVIGILANNGIRGSDAGTLLKSALLALQSPSKQAQRAMDDLNLTAYDSQGNFVGLRSIFEQLQVAQGDMTQQQYEMATSTLFGSDAARLAGIAAREGGEGFDAMAAAVGRQGAAADLATAKSKGLRGAIEAFKSQVETVQIDVFERAAPSLERLVRAAAERLPDVAESALSTADDVVAAFQDMAPRIGRAFATRRDSVVAAWRQLGEPMLAGARDLVDKGLDVVVKSAERLSELAGQAVDTVEPLAHSVGDLASSLAKANGPLDTAGNLLETAADAGGLLLDVAGPLVHVLSGAVDVFSALPGPLQTGALALVAFRLAGGRAAEWANGGLTGRMTAPFREFGQTVRMQMALADDSITGSQAFRGGIATAIERQAPQVTGAWREITGAYRGGVAEAAQAWSKHGLAVDGFATRVSGLGRAAQTAGRVGIGGLRTAGAGLVGFMGGPWGVGLAAGTVAVGAITNEMARSEQQTKSWGAALVQGGGAAQKALEDAAKPSLWEKFKFNLTHPFNTEKVGERQVREAKDAAQDVLESMTPLERAQQRVTTATENLQLAQERYAADSPQVVSASLTLQAAQSALETRQRGVATATQSATDAMHLQVQAALSAANADLGASVANTALATAMDDYKATLADGTLSTIQRQQATDAMTQSALTAGSAAAEQARAHSTAATEEGKQKDADAALLVSLQATAEQLGSATPAAITSLIASLQSSGVTAVTTAGQMRDMGLSVVAIPGSKDVKIIAPTEDQRRRLADLGYTVTNIPGTKNVIVSAETAAAQAAIDSFVYLNSRRSIQVKLNVERGTTTAIGGGLFAATGGYIRGPGTGTSDSIPAWLSNGEYVIRAASTARSRSGLDAVNRGDWAAAAREFSALADRESRAVIASMAGSRAAAAAGRFAAGGYVSGRTSGTEVVTVPQRVQNIQNVLNAAPQLPTVDQLQRMLRESEVLADA